MRVLVALAALSMAPSAWACSCIQPDLKQAWHESSDLLGVKILAERVVGQERQYRVRVIQPFSGCTQPGDILVLTTHRDSATCGATYTVGEKYVLAAEDVGGQVGGNPSRSVNSCGFAQTFASLSADQLDFLWTREIECNGQISCSDGSNPVSCLVDPCVGAQCATGTCESNTCAGGCVAEFYDTLGYPTCEPW